MVESIPWKRFLLITLTLGLSCCLGGSADAITGGSWGSSVGGSSGSWGSGGSVGGRQPIRSLLGRLGGRASGRSGGSSGSTGSSGSSGSTGSSGGSRVGFLRGGLFNGGLLGRRASGSTGGWSGSSGGWSSTGSTGSMGSSGSLASTGSYASSGSFASTGSYASTGSGYASSSTGAVYGGWGSSYLGTINSAPLETGYVVEESYPVGDYGFSSGYPIEGGMIMDASPILDGGSIDSMIEGGIPMDGFAPAAGEYYQTPAVPATGTETPAGEQPPGPANDGNSTSVEPESNNQIAQTASVLTLVLPEDAKVFINDRLTTTPGAKRSYRSNRLATNREYQYRVKAVLIRDGNEVVRSELVTMKPGLDKTVRFDFAGSSTQTVAKVETDAPVVTKLALKVPANAKVVLCGNQTNRMGTVRTFETESLKPGKVWKGYKVEVEFQRDGKMVKEERLLDMVGGQSYAMAIGVDESKDQVAAK